MDNQLTAAIAEDRLFWHKRPRITISVAQEQAVGSYNEDFETWIHLTINQARELRDWLTQAMIDAELKE
jgi:hypothetical protein